MDEILGTVKIDNNRSLHLGTLSKNTILEVECEDLGFEGYFLFETSDEVKSKGITILGKTTSLEAAFRLMDIWQTRQ